MSEHESAGSALTPEQQFLNDLWGEHIRHEFATCDTDATLDTMVPNAYVNHIPVMTSGVGREALCKFYSRHFIPKMPPDTEIVPVSRTIGSDRLVDESNALMSRIGQRSPCGRDSTRIGSPGPTSPASSTRM